MKKIMIALAMAFSVGAFAACEYAPEAAKDTAWVYKWKFTGKTTYGKQTKAAPSGLCGYVASSCDCAVRAPASLKIEGYTWYCAPKCGSDTFEDFAEVNEIFWQKKPFKASLAGGVSTDVSNIIGKKGTKFEAAGTAKFTEFVNAGAVREGTYTLTYAGLGAYSKKNSRVKNVKGKFAGYLDQPHYITKTVCANAGFWNCEDMSLVCSGPSVAFGKWSATYKKNASKRYLNRGRLPAVPSWVKALND